MEIVISIKNRIILMKMMELMDLQGKRRRKKVRIKRMRKVRLKDQIVEDQKTKNIYLQILFFIHLLHRVGGNLVIVINILIQPPKLVSSLKLHLIKNLKPKKVLVVTLRPSPRLRQEQKRQKKQAKGQATLLQLKNLKHYYDI